jgi:hypothetical protein
MMVDAVALELMLHELLLAALQEAHEGDEICLEFAERRGGHADVTLSRNPPRGVIADERVMERLSALSRQMGAELRTVDLVITLAIPVQRLDLGVRESGQVGSIAGMGSTADAAPLPGPVPELPSGPASGPPSGDGESGHDVRRSREREHGEASRL